MAARSRRRVHALLEAEVQREAGEQETDYFWASVWAFRDSLKGRVHSESGELIREDRDER